MSDRNTVTVFRKRASAAPKPTSERAVNAARRQGIEVETKPRHRPKQDAPMNPAKLDEETEELRHESLPLDIGKLIQMGRHSKGMTQRELALKINERPQVVNEYEAARAVPNNAVLGKIERAIGIRLRGKDRGKPLAAPAAKK